MNTPQPIQRLCSHCRQPGHSIRWCFDESIDILLLNCQEQSLILSESLFKVWLNCYNVNLLKAICMRLGLVATLSQLGNKLEIIQHVTNDFYRHQRFNALLLAFAYDLNRMNDIMPYPHQQQEPVEPVEPIKIIKNVEELELDDDAQCCPVCYESDNLGKYETCNHIICANCFHETQKRTPNVTCSLCRAKVTQINIFSDESFTAFQNKKGLITK